jgi:heme-degrading monooxygenase HmoA
MLKPPYYAVIFRSIRNAEDSEYSDMAYAMETLAKKQEGYLGIESVRDAASGVGVTVSYWKDEKSILLWKQNMDHLSAQQLGQEKWYVSYKVEICKVERSYEWNEAQHG